MLAFIINVGLFVKAKINLQNATDAAAFSGAATQARQLTNIAYANWELRNTYKEWMFKYYVLGQLGIVPTKILPALGSNSNMDFTVKSDLYGTNADQYDKYNLPSICIHNGSGKNICASYKIPGIPRFPSIGVAGISEIHEGFVNSLVNEKAKDCSSRSRINFLAALNWAYGSGISDFNITNDPAPLITANRPGAWLEAIELAMRIRNLEMIVNRPPVSEISIENLKDFQGGTDIGLNERPIKAFWSGYRNMSGGTYKDNNTAAGNTNGPYDEFSRYFKLTELAPQAFEARPAGKETLSSFLIPDTFNYSNGEKATQKAYLDLQLVPVNYATMYSIFVNAANKFSSDVGERTEAECGVSKTALPVPGYIMGFTKNPDVLTYYAVKAESKFTGLFFPSRNGTGIITLTAYAAAKPFGGRIGPKLFQFPENTSIGARGDDNLRSAPYVSGFRISQSDLKPTFEAGMPIPPYNDFWLNDGSGNLIGGLPLKGNDIKYAIPNLVYDFTEFSDLQNQAKGAGNRPIQLIETIPFKAAQTKEASGLYNPAQYRSMYNGLGSVKAGDSVPGDLLQRILFRARRPTKYDAINYLIPAPQVATPATNAVSLIQKIQIVPNTGFYYKLFAPLVGPSTLYKTPNEIETVMKGYMLANSDAVDKYVGALYDVAVSVYTANKGDGSGPSAGPAKEAAETIHINASTGGGPIPPLLPATTDPNAPGCHNDIASQFYHFFKGPAVGCGVTPLKDLIIKFIQKHSIKSDDGGIDRSLFYVAGYYEEPGSPIQNLPSADQLMTAYYPGTRQGANNDATIAHPLNAGSEIYSAKRNFYSTKFFPLAKIMDGPNTDATLGKVDYESDPTLHEGTQAASDLNKQVHIQNQLKSDPAITNNKYFLDF